MGVAGKGLNVPVLYLYPAAASVTRQRQGPFVSPTVSEIVDQK